MKIRAILVVALLVLPLVFVACAGGGGGGGGTQQVTVVGTDFKFTPNQITLKVNQPAQIVFQNKGSTAHNLTIPEFNVKTPDVQPNQSATIDFTPNKTGTFPFDCTIPGHAEAGMTGQLTVQ